MKRRKVVTILAVLISILASETLEARTVFSIEWGYTATFYQFCDFTFHSEEGMTVNDSFHGVDYRSNGLFNAGIGFGSSKYITSIHAGLAGIQDSRRVVPVTLRETFYPKGLENDGAFILVDAGTAFAKTLDGKPIFIARLGAGHHKAITDKVGINLGLFLKVAADKPVKYYDSTNKKFLYSEDISHSSRDILGLDFTIAISF